MKKSDLKTGYRVVTRNGDVYVVMLGAFESGDVIVDINNKGYCNLSNEYDDDMSIRTSHCHALDIVEVYEVNFASEVLSKKPDKTLLWKREESVPEYTMEELTNKLGHTFKIKK